MKAIYINHLQMPCGVTNLHLLVRGPLVVRYDVVRGPQGVVRWSRGL